MTVYGYARVSTDGQSLASQNGQLHAAGCAKVYAEKISGAKSNRPARPSCCGDSVRATC
jgi:DNA invertase Pin-like site-specific DNA recombinase